MVTFDINDAYIFFTSGIGILMQIILFTAAIIPGIKYLNRKWEESLNNHIKGRIEPTVLQLCKELAEVGKDFSIFKGETNTAIKYINDAVMHMRSDLDDQEIREYRKSESQSEGVRT